MTKPVMIRSVLALLAMTAAGCGALDNKAEMSDKRDAKVQDGKTTPAPDKGGLALRMPKNKEGYETKTLLVTLERSPECWEDPGPIEPQHDDRETADKVDTATYTGQDDGDSTGTGIAMPCHSGEVLEYKFDFEEGKQVNIDDLAAGSYFVRVQLFDAKTELIEQGESWTYIEAGRTSYVAIALYGGNGAGQLVIDIYRAGEWPVPQPEPMPCYYGEDYAYCDGSTGVGAGSSTGSAGSGDVSTGAPTSAAEHN